MIFNEGNFPDLPNSWAPLHVEEAYENIAVKEKTQVKKYLSSGQLPVIDQGANLIGGYVNDLEKSVTSDLPVIIFGDHTRAIKYIDFLFAAGADGIKVLKPKGFFEPKLFYHFLRAIRLPDKGYARHFQYLRSSKIALPPLPEQKRITDKLDTLLAQVDSCQSHLERVPQILKRFRQSVLAVAASGRLTEEWREEKGFLLSDWSQVSAGDLIEKIEAGVNVKCEERPPLEHERGLVKISAVTWGKFNDDESKTLPQSHDVPERTRIKVGDFLISRANTLELVGACVIAEQVNRPVFLSDKVLRLVMDDDIKKWMLYWLRSDAGRKQLEALASGNQLSMRNISQANLRRIQVKLPSPEERDEIVSRIERLFTFADHLEAHWQTGQNIVDKLTPSLLAKAFRGELVEQDPEDEPATVLLERIRTARSRQGEIRNLRGKLNWEGDLDEQRKSRFTAK